MKSEHIINSQYVEVIDCTLRDGEQAPGVWFTAEEKVQLALALGDAGVDLLDAGFPRASSVDLESMQEMKHQGISATVAATARALKEDVLAAKASKADEVFLFMPTSSRRIKNTLNIDFDQFVETFRRGAQEVVSQNMGLNIVCEDAMRTEPENIIRVIEAISKDIHIHRIVLADSVGCATPTSTKRLFAQFRTWIDDSIGLCAHSHNDFGMASANTLASVEGGATAVSCTVNGVGERAGNADLAEVVAALTHLYELNHNVNPLALSSLSKMVEKMSGFVNAPHKAVTGFNVFRHESGIHVDSLIKDKNSYEFLPPKWMGRETEFILGKHSGGAQIRHLLQSHGVEFDEESVADLLTFVREVVNGRDKSDHSEILARYQAFCREQLSGVNPQVVLNTVTPRNQPRGGETDI